MTKCRNLNCKGCGRFMVKTVGGYECINRKCKLYRASAEPTSEKDGNTE